MQANTKIQYQGGGAEVVAALDTQCRVIMAVMLREAKSRYGSHKLGFFWVLLEPTLFIAGFAAIRAVVGFQAPHGMSAELFMLTGMVPFLMFRETMQQVSESISANKQLLAFPQVTTFDLIVARALLEFATMVTVFIVILIIMVLIGFEVDIEFPLEFLGASVLLFLNGVGLGSLIGSLVPFMPSLRQLSRHAFGRPLLFTSGIFFTVDQFPAGAREMLLWNPLLHLIEMVRSAFFKSFNSDYVDLMYATIFTLIMLVIGLMAHQALHKKAIGL